MQWQRYKTNCRNTNSSDWGRNLSQHQTRYIVLCMFSLLHAVQTSSGYLDLFYAHCTHHITLLSVARNNLKVSGRQVKWRNKEWYQTILQWNTQWLIFSVMFEIVIFLFQCISVSQWTACLAVLTWQSMMISATLSVRRS